MKLTSNWSSEEQQRDDDEQSITQKRRAIKNVSPVSTVAQNLIEATNTVETERIGQEQVKAATSINTASIQEASRLADTHIQKVSIPTFLSYTSYIAAIETVETQSVVQDVQDPAVVPTLQLPQQSVQYPSNTPTKYITKKYALLFIALLSILVFHSLAIGPTQFAGPQGWAYVLGGPASAGNGNLLGIGRQNPLKPGSTAQPTHKLTPQEYVNMIVQRMSPDQKLGQTMIIQFLGPSYSLDLTTMVKQYNVGSVLIFAANQNIVSKDQLKGLIRQMQVDSPIPLAVAIDQEGGTVDRLNALDGPRPSEATIGASGNPGIAQQAGIQDAKDLSYYGINLNLAPVVDVSNNYNSELYLDHRTYGNTAAIVTRMASAYLNGLQQSGKVVGTLKHFPGLGDVSVDPHLGEPQLTRSQSDLQQIDWAPYHNLIQQGNVHAVMVTHELVQAVDSTKPSSLSNKVVTGILRNQLGFQGVIMTDSLTMESISASYDESQAAALSVEAGCDLLMGASTPSDVASMMQGIKQAMNDGQISQQRIDDSVRRILMMKYQMGLLTIPTTD